MDGSPNSSMGLGRFLLRSPLVWGFPPFQVYAPGHNIETKIYVANFSAETKRYTLESRLYAVPEPVTGTSKLLDIVERLERSSAQLIEPITVEGDISFLLESSFLLTLHTILRFDETGFILVVALIDVDSHLDVDKVASYLIPGGE